MRGDTPIMQPHHQILMSASGPMHRVGLAWPSEGPALGQGFQYADADGQRGSEAELRSAEQISSHELTQRVCLPL